MRQGRLFQFVLWAAVIGGAELCPAEDIVEEAVTKPSKDRTISFVRSGLVAKVYVKDDEVVRAGQLLAKLDDEAESVQLQQLRAVAEDTTEIEAEKAQLAQAKVELELQKKARENKVATDLDVMRAETQVSIAEARVKIAEFKNRINRLRHQEASLQLARMELRSPIDGIVEEIAVDEGEAVDSQMRPVMRIISIDPMWIETSVPTRAARQFLRKGQDAVVVFDGGVKKRGTIVKISADADPASETVRVRVELPNPEQRGTGETVTVIFPVSSESGFRAPTGAPDRSTPSRKEHSHG